MAYVRTKDKGIFLFCGTHAFGSVVVAKKNLIDFGFCFAEADIVDKKDTIEELIKPEDLIEVDGLDYYRIEKDRGDYFVSYGKDIIHKEDITAVFVNTAKDPQMRGEFMETACKDPETGRWELV